jgi:RNA polymerase sigma-70 factor, ECF subfamily
MDGGKQQPTFDAFFAEHFRAVFIYVAARVSDKATAEDLSAKIFDKAYRSWPPRASQPQARKAWLFKIARNGVYDHYREASRRPTVSLDNGLIQGQLSSFEEESMIERIDLQSALESLSERDQTVLTLRMAGLTNRELADVLGISEDAASVAYLRALRRLRERLEPSRETRYTWR